MVRAQEINPAKMHVNITVEKLQVVLYESCGYRLLVFDPNSLRSRLSTTIKIRIHDHIFAHLDQLVNSVSLFLFKQEIEHENDQQDKRNIQEYEYLPTAYVLEEKVEVVEAVRIRGNWS